MSQNARSNEEKDTTWAWWHDDTDLEVVLRWHTFACLCTLLGCSKDVPKTWPSIGDSQEEDIEPKRNGVLDIHDDLFVIAYLQTSGVSVGLTPKEPDRVMHKVKQFKWEGNSLFQVWIDGWIWVILCP